ncbi:hypothetical protein F5Y03DRAFT_406461 [Xylaria venustula]|nr:hypothetical protein F5Y03DRAFT_406461 [Xylaria venustula]
MSNINNDGNLVALLSREILRFPAASQALLTTRRRGGSNESQSSSGRTRPPSRRTRRGSRHTRSYPTSRSTLKSTTYMSAVSNWWRAAPKETNLEQVISSYAHLLPIAPQPTPVPAQQQPQAQATGQHIEQMSLWNLLLLLINECPDEQVHIEWPFNKLSARARCKCAVGTVQINFSPGYSDTMATYLLFTQRLLDCAPPAVPSAAAQFNYKWPAGSPGDTTMYPALHTTGAISRSGTGLAQTAEDGVVTVAAAVMVTFAKKVFPAIWQSHPLQSARRRVCSNLQYGQDMRDVRSQDKELTAEGTDGIGPRPVPERQPPSWSETSGGTNVLATRVADLGLEGRGVVVALQLVRALRFTANSCRPIKHSAIKTHTTNSSRDGRVTPR